MVNVSSPNTPGLRDLQAVEKLEPLLVARAATADARDRARVPLLVKIAPDLADEDVLAVADLALAIGPRRDHRHQHHDLPRRPAHPAPATVEAVGAGGLSGPPLHRALARGAAAAPRARRRPPHARRRRRHHHRRRRARAGSTPAPTCCRPTPASSTRGRCGPAGSLRGSCSRDRSEPGCTPRIADRGPLCVGIDPHAALLRRVGARRRRRRPRAVRADRGRGASRRTSRWSSRSRRSTSGSAAAASPCSSGSIAESRAAGALVLLDVKRGDIGSTSQAYADAYLDPASPLAVRRDHRQPVPRLRLARPDRRHRARARRRASSCSRSPPTRRARRSSTPAADGGGTVAGRVLDHLRRLNAGAAPLGSFGAVVGATIGATDARTSPSTARSSRPGFGAQGGTVADVRRIFGSRRRRSCRAPRARCCGSARTVDGDARRRAAATNDELARREAALAGRSSPLVASPLLAACGGSRRRTAYCDAVAGPPAGALPSSSAAASPDALLQALDVFRDLPDEAPGDITDEWQQVVGPDRGAARRARGRRRRPGDLRPRRPARRPRRRATGPPSTRPPSELGSGTTAARAPGRRPAGPRRLRDPAHPGSGRATWRTRTRSRPGCAASIAGPRGSD